MQKSTLIGIVVGVLIIGVISTFFMLNRMAPKVQQDARNFIDTNVPLIVNNWSSKELIKRSSPDLLKVATLEQFVELFKMLSEKLGPLKEYKGSKGEASLTTSFRGIIRTGAFQSEAVFAKGPAVILCRIVWQDDAWKINEFRVQSDVLNP
jgi:hypothetical protein